MDNTGTTSPGTLAKFHLGLAADGTSCAMVFIDEQQHSIACIAGFADLEGFITSLTQAAAELARRRADLLEDDEAEEAVTTRSARSMSHRQFQDV